MNKSKFLWFTDTHLDKVLPWTLIKFIVSVKAENPKGIILTGDISNGLMVIWHLRLLATFIKCPIYFVLGNHDYHYSSLSKIRERIRKLCKEYPNLIWMNEAGVVHVNDEVAFIGTEGWYDAANGKPNYLQLTIDWFLIEEFRKLPNMKARIDVWRSMAEESTRDISAKLQEAISKNYKSIYIFTHFPPWKEATRNIGTFFDWFWLPYNTNICLGNAIEDIMVSHEKSYIHTTVLAGHTHSPEYIRVSKNIACQVGNAQMLRMLNSQNIFI